MRWGIAGVGVGLGCLGIPHWFFKSTHCGVGQDPPCSRKNCWESQRGSEGTSGWVRARLNVDVALQDPISWEEGWRSCTAAQGTDHEHKHLCSAPHGSCKISTFGSVSPGAFPEVFSPFIPTRPVRVGILWLLCSWARSTVPAPRAAGVGASA